MKKRVGKKLTALALTGVMVLSSSLPVLAEESDGVTAQFELEQDISWRALDRSNWKVTASSERPGTHEAAFAIDGNTSTVWHVAGSGDPTYGLPYTFDVDLGAADCNVSKIELTGRTGQGLSAFPKTLEVYSSSDGEMYTKIKDVTFSTTPVNGMIEAILLDEPINDQYVRLLITDNWFTTADQAVCFAEINMYQAKVEIPQDLTEITSPDGELTTYFWMTEDGQPKYSVVRNDEVLVKNSALGLLLTDANGGAMQENMTLISSESESCDSTWEPAVPLTQSTIRDHYNQTIFHMEDDQDRKVDIIFRNYDEGVAFRYYFPEEENALDSFEIVDEKSQFAIPTGTIAHAYGTGNQQIPGNTAVENLGTSVRFSPIVLEYASGNTAVGIYEADLYDYGRLKLQQTGNGVITTNVNWSSNIQAKVPFETPWRVISVADQIGELQLNQTLQMNLSDECAIEDTSWIKPGGLIREARLTDQNTIDCIDFAAEHNIPYIMYDSGWYGTENDPDYSPMVPYKGTFPYMKGGSTMRSCDVDIRDHIEYANSKDVGIILYVNKVHLEAYDLDEMFQTYEDWGIKGVKLGFVNYGSQYYSKWLEDAIATAAKHKLICIVHDEVIPSGLERTYPNLVNMEGVLGDEGKPSADNDLKQIFTRSIVGPADHCFCMPVHTYIATNKTDAFNMALSMLYYAPTPSLYWYGVPSTIMNEERPELKFWDDMPTTWDESRYVESKYGEYYTMARRNGDEWYLGSASAVDRTFNFAPDFLEEGTKYLAEIYTNSPNDTAENNKIAISRYIVDSTTAVNVDIMAAGGFCVRMVPAAEEELASVPEMLPERFELEKLVNEVRGMDMTQFTDASVRNCNLMEQADEAEKVLARPDAAAEEMQAMIDLLNEKKAVLIEKTRLLYKVELSPDQISADNERPDPMDITKAIDGDPETFWHTTAGANPPMSLTLDFGEKKYIQKIEIQGRNSDSLNGYPLVFGVMTSEDGKNFTEIMEVNWKGKAVTRGCIHGFELPEGTNTQYIRLQFRECWISGSPYMPTCIAELNVYETPFGELGDLVRTGNEILGLLKDEAAKAELQERIWDAIDYMQTSETEEGLEEQIAAMKDAIAKATEAIPPMPYLDVEEDSWYYDAVKYVYYKGIMTGLNETTFGPAETLSRAQIAVMLYRLKGAESVAYNDRFADVPADTWFTDAVLWAADNDIANGYPDTCLFGVEDAVTREQAVTMMYRYAVPGGEDNSDVDLGAYTDGDSVSDFAKEAMQWAIANEIIQGSDGNLNPQNCMNRAEAATVMMRFMEL